ncbi:MAG: hypothetical protein WC441_03910 [Patescibacteria group bacterium]
MENLIFFQRTLNPTVLKVSIRSGSENRTVDAANRLNKELADKIASAHISKAFTGLCASFIDIEDGRLIISTDVGKIEPNSTEEEDKIYIQEIMEALENAGINKAIRM